MSRHSSEEVVRVYHRVGGSATKAGRILGLSESGVRYHVEKLGLNKIPIADGRVSLESIEKKPLPKEHTTRYVLTSAQNNTKVHEKFWLNLEAFADYFDAEIHVGTYTYNKTAYKPSVKWGSEPEKEETWYDQRILKHVSDVPLILAPGLVWCGELNILPTATRPLSGLETYTGRKSGIFPHAKIAMTSVASNHHEATKFNYTTGTVTQRNYLQKKAGQKAEFHHTYGALIVEVTPNGTWFVRQLVACDDGSFQDLDVCVHNQEVTDSHWVEAITWGDIHHASMDQRMKDVNWGNGDSIFDELHPRYQFIHDLFDGRSVNHHARKDPHTRFQNHVDQASSVDDEIEECTTLLNNITRNGVYTVVVDSNHDSWLERWLREHDYRDDPLNAEFFLEAQLEKYRSIRRGDRQFHLLEWAIRRHGLVNSRIKFLRQDESFETCSGQIENGMHGHLGPNGSKGSPLGLSKLGKRANTAHTHSAGIIDGLYVAGASCNLRQGYNRGPGSWSHSHVITYPNGKRCIITVWDEKWRG